MELQAISEIIATLKLSSDFIKGEVGGFENRIVSFEVTGFCDYDLHYLEQQKLKLIYVEVNAKGNVYMEYKKLPSRLAWEYEQSKGE